MFSSLPVAAMSMTLVVHGKQVLAAAAWEAVLAARCAGFRIALIRKGRAHLVLKQVSIERLLAPLTSLPTKEGVVGVISLASVFPFVHLIFPTSVLT